MAVGKRTTIAAVVTVVLTFLLGWYVVAANYGYSSLAGTYVYDQNGEKCTLRLQPDGSFSEELVQKGNSQKAKGTWHRYGEAHVSFSNGFLKISGQELNQNGEAHGQFDKTLGFFPSLTLAPTDRGPRLKRKLFD